MFDLQKILEERLAALEGKKIPKKARKNELNDVSVEYIKKSWQRAGILDEKGRLIERDII
ncbi:MAG: hypothetical protein WAX77_08480 [Methylococcaceae bacterium]